MRCGYWIFYLLQTIVLLTTFVLLPEAIMAQQTQGELSKRIKTQVQPAYPDLARRMNIKGVVKLEVTVAPSGKVKSTHVVGGHPLLVSASEDAIRRWKFEPAGADTTGMVEFIFQPN